MFVFQSWRKNNRIWDHITSLNRYQIREIFSFLSASTSFFRPFAPKELGNQVYTVFPVNSEEAITVEKDCHGNFIIPFAQTVRHHGRLGSGTTPRHSKISDNINSLENKGEVLIFYHALFAFSILHYFESLPLT